MSVTTCGEKVKRVGRAGNHSSARIDGWLVYGPIWVFMNTQPDGGLAVGRISAQVAAFASKAIFLSCLEEGDFLSVAIKEPVHAFLLCQLAAGILRAWRVGAGVWSRRRVGRDTVGQVGEAGDAGAAFEVDGPET